MYLYRKNRILNLFTPLAFLALAACAPQLSNPTEFTTAPATSISTEASEPRVTTTPNQEAVTLTPASTSEAACFTFADIAPFAFTPDSTSILVRGNRGVQIFNLEALEDF
jgi:hypothetical protein